jgi:multiple sugar transport system permease protein
LYRAGFRDGLLGYANVLALVLFVVAFGVTVLLLRRSRAFTQAETA